MTSMKITHSIMFIFLAALGAFFLGMIYGEKADAPPATPVETLMAVDSEFSDYSVANGYYAAFAEYLAGDAVALNTGRQPVIGRENIIAPMAGAPEGAQLVWVPVAGDIAASGDLGYTWGRYVLTSLGEDGEVQSSHGKYMTVWKLQEDGSWKAVLDGGNTNPPPTIDP